MNALDGNELAAIRARAEAATYYGGDMQELAEDTLALLALVDCDWDGLAALIAASPTLRKYLTAIRGNVEALAAKARTAALADPKEDT